MAHKPESDERLIASNHHARSNYFIDSTIEAGIVLTGTEVKSLRLQSPNLRDSFVEVRRNSSGMEAWLLNTHIGPYTHGNIWNHDPMRKRKLLLHKHEIEQLFGAVTLKGLSIIPTKMYFKKGIAKIELGLGKGKKKHDKRDTLKEKSAEREMEQAKRAGSKNRGYED
ncbi:MAG: SsrA-binding protein SmpB [Methylotenera sp.]|nr:SsrA-binding protein SmpB [Oligoflexia bacterium]